MERRKRKRRKERKKNEKKEEKDEKIMEWTGKDRRRKERKG